MKKSNLKRNVVLSILFFLPVAFLLMLYPAKHNYIPLDVVNKNVAEMDGFIVEGEQIQFKDHITVLAFLGSQPLDKAIAASNLKELVYDKFKGFKTFQIVAVVQQGTEDQVEALKKEINTYEDLRFWHYAYGTEAQIEDLFKSLKTQESLDDFMSTDHVFIIDKDVYQRGRLDAREAKEIEANKPLTQLFSYDCIEVAVIKNKMSEDVRILFTEYRQKRKGNFDSTSRRAQDLKDNDE
ncbi:hypothetical protein [Winogradskyella sp. A3E31]|uniref:hypothetical protein n=1 Tax=Winogradskyella sp. A3E31 TaxID=3349637 RepID=UPI00398AA9FC